MAVDDLDWLPPDGVRLTRRDLESLLPALWSLFDGTERDEPNRAHTTTIVLVLARAIEREE
ncbi:MAG: hypothetical protein QNM02_04295 [Acidimicrobiia bacterium]|nr:hypothetical protein [Acidimicrobiia bacterium]